MLREFPFRLSTVLALALLSAGGVGCSSGGKKSSQQSSASSSAESVRPQYGPDAPAEGSPAEGAEGEEVDASVYGPTQVEIRPITLVLGPGLARGFAAAGVIKTLHDHKIPIGQIVATEMGAVVGGLYSLSKSINEFEWSLLKLREDVFLERGGFLRFFEGKKDSEGKKLSEVLSQILESKDLSEARIPIRMGLRRQNSEDLYFFQEGPAALALRAAVGVPGFMQGADWGAIGLAESAARIKPFPIDEARRAANGPVVVVDVLSPAPSRSSVKLDPLLEEYLETARHEAEQELPDADLVIRPDLREFSYLDFKRKSDISFRGKTAAEAKLAELRHLVGLPPR